MKHKFVVKIGYTSLAFDSAETAMRVYALLTESTPVTTIYCPERPEALKGIQFVRETDAEIEMTRLDATKFMLNVTEAEFKEKCKPRPTEVEGEMLLVEEVKPAPALEGPTDADVVEDDFPL